MMEAFVYVIESPAPRDVYDGRTEGRALCEALQLADIKYSYTMALDKQTFIDALSTADNSRLVIESNRHRGPSHFYAPILHFSGHGNSEGIALCDSTLISWDELRNLLLPINNAIPAGLMVTFSSCSGASGARMSMYLGADDKPFCGCLGSFEGVRWDDALVAFIAFYHNFFKDGDVDKAVNAMRYASGENSFFYQPGQVSKQQYENYCLNITGQQNGLSAGIEAAAPSSLFSNPGT
ncbi:hypothetical protein J7481_01745 [Labrenzia sp. R4_2]|uniref:hypothetical protein n=1 Tax=Labrenzia sp. R4_2 TaxID=2821107 RepID=UPI001AD9D2BB|nr:hypothetical protein [Labrenzia sp. R4_2]MBO9418202.1 hypothetical protein [Labrenzia sp. R4_2]